MLATERRARIVEGLRDARVMSTDDLSRNLQVSAETIRRDLAVLEQQGLLSRVHGGAALLGAATGEEASFAERARSATDAKDRIGKAAAGLIRSGQTIVFDVGTSALRAARALPLDFTGTIATCSLLVATELSDRPNVDIFVCGGKLRSGDLALSNAVAQRFFADFNADVAFLGSGGVDARAGLTDYYIDEVAVRQTIIQNSAASYVLVDATKVGRIARHRVAGLNELAGIVTDHEPPTLIRDAIEESGGRVVLA